MRSIILLVCTAVGLAGCASGVTEEEQDAARWAREIRIIRPDEVGDRDYKVLAELEERVRIDSLGGVEGARSEAERNMRYRAAKVDADVVVFSGCRRLSREQDVDASLNPTLMCLGHAVQWVNY
jgi:hypothetical protein